MIAVLVGVALVLRVIVDARPADVTGVQAVWGMYRFFTILTNTMVGVIAALVAIGRPPSASLQAAFAVFIAMVGVVFHVLLADLVDYSGLAMLVNQITHTAVPLAFVVYWVLFAPKAGIRLAHLPIWLLYPLIYCGYALWRGSIDGIYPYPFLDAGTLGLQAVVINVAGLLVFFAISGAVTIGLARLMARAR